MVVAESGRVGVEMDSGGGLAGTYMYRIEAGKLPVLSTTRLRGP